MGIRHYGAISLGLGIMRSCFSRNQLNLEQWGCAMMTTGRKEESWATQEDCGRGVKHEEGEQLSLNTEMLNYSKVGTFQIQWTMKKEPYW